MGDRCDKNKCSEVTSTHIRMRLVAILILIVLLASLLGTTTWVLRRGEDGKISSQEGFLPGSFLAPQALSSTANTTPATATSLREEEMCTLARDTGFDPAWITSDDLQISSACRSVLDVWYREGDAAALTQAGQCLLPEERQRFLALSLLEHLRQFQSEQRFGLDAFCQSLDRAAQATRNEEVRSLFQELQEACRGGSRSGPISETCSQALVEWSQGQRSALPEGCSRDVFFERWKELFHMTRNLRVRNMAVFCSAVRAIYEDLRNEQVIAWFGDQLPCQLQSKDQKLREWYARFREALAQSPPTQGLPGVEVWRQWMDRKEVLPRCPQFRNASTSLPLSGDARILSLSPPTTSPYRLVQLFSRTSSDLCASLRPDGRIHLLPIVRGPEEPLPRASLWWCTPQNTFVSATNGGIWSSPIGNLQVQTGNVPGRLPTLQWHEESGQLIYHATTGKKALVVVPRGDLRAAEMNAVLMLREPTDVEDMETRWDVRPVDASVLVVRLGPEEDVRTPTTWSFSNAPWSLPCAEITLGGWLWMDREPTFGGDAAGWVVFSLGAQNTPRLRLLPRPEEGTYTCVWEWKGTYGRVRTWQSTLPWSQIPVARWVHLAMAAGADGSATFYFQGVEMGVAPAETDSGSIAVYDGDSTGVQWWPRESGGRVRGWVMHTARLAERDVMRMRERYAPLEVQQGVVDEIRVLRNEKVVVPLDPMAMPDRAVLDHPLGWRWSPRAPPLEKNDVLQLEYRWEVPRFVRKVLVQGVPEVSTPITWSLLFQDPASNLFVPMPQDPHFSGPPQGREDERIEVTLASPVRTTAVRVTLHAWTNELPALRVGFQGDPDLPERAIKSTSLEVYESAHADHRELPRTDIPSDSDSDPTLRPELYFSMRSRASPSAAPSPSAASRSLAYTPSAAPSPSLSPSSLL